MKAAASPARKYLWSGPPPKSAASLTQIKGLRFLCDTIGAKQCSGIRADKVEIGGCGG
jgi:hypothetical protein